MSNVVDSKILLARDYSSLMEWSLEAIPKITEDWTDFNIIAPEMVWLSAACYSYDVLNYTLDRKYLNNQIRFSRSFDNLLNMCTLNGIYVMGYDSSKIILNINYDITDLPANSSVTLPKGSIFSVFDTSTLRTIQLVTEDVVNIVSGDNLVTCYEGSSQTLTLLASSFTVVGTYVIATENIAHNTFKLEVNGVAWRKVKDAFLITDNEPSYSIHVHSNGHTLLKLCVGYSDLVGANNIDIEFLTTLGDEGNISTSSEITSNFDFIDNYSLKVTDRMTISILSSSGGTDALNIEEVRSLLGTTSSDVETLIVNSDYEDIITQVEYVYGAVVQDINSIKEIYYIADANISTYGVTDEDIQNDIDDLIKDRVPAFTNYSINPINIRPVSLNMTVYLDRNELDIAELETKIINFINEKYSRETIEAGSELSRSEIALGIEDLSRSVASVLFRYPLADIYLNWNEIFNIDSISITFERG